MAIVCGAAATRAAHLIDGEIVRFWFGPARGDEALPGPPRRGDVYSGRVRRVVGALKGAFIDIGLPRDGFLRFERNAAPPIEGARILAMVARPPIGAKGAVLTIAPGLSDAEQEKLAAGHPGRVGEASRDAILQAIEHAPLAAAGKPDRWIVDDPDAARLLRARGLTVDVAEAPWRDAGADEALDAAFERKVRLNSGAELIFDEAEGLAVVDVDSSAAAESLAGAPNDRINLDAASRLFLELARRNIGGRVVVDFLPPTDHNARRRLHQALSASKTRHGRRLGRVSDDGLLDLNSSRSELSLIEEATEPDATFPRPGRRFTLDWSTKAALWRLETVLARQPKARPRLLVGAEIAAYLEPRRDWISRLQQRRGARFVIEAGAKLEPRGHDIAE